MWWDVHQGVPDFGGERWTQDGDAARKWSLRHVPSVARPGLCLDGSRIHQGSNSGYQAINFAVLRGAARILLLGYDMRLGEGGKRHWFGDHPGGLNKASAYGQWIPLFRSMIPHLEAAGVEVLNCTPGSALEAFPMARLADVL